MPRQPHRRAESFARSTCAD